MHELDRIHSRDVLENLIAGVIALALAVYLVVALLDPERWS